MKRQITILFLIFAVILVNRENASACIFTSGNERGVVFRLADTLNIDLLREKCDGSNCRIEDGKIMILSSYDSKVAVILEYRHPNKADKPLLSVLRMVIPKKDGLVSAPGGKYVLNPAKFDWSAAIVSQLKFLSENGILTGVSDKDVREIGDILKKGRGFVYFNPEECENSEHSGVEDGSRRYGWLLGEPNCLIDKYENNCPQIGCYRCGDDNELEFSKLPKRQLIFNSKK